MSDISYCTGIRMAGFGIANPCPIRDHCQRYLDGRGRKNGSWLDTAPFTRDDMGQVQCQMFRDGQDER